MKLSSLIGLAWQHRAVRIVSVCLVLLLSICLLFDWNWLRGPVQRYLSHASGRPVTIQHLDLKLDQSFHPVIKLKGLYIANASWAHDPQQPLVQVSEVSFSFATWSSLFGEKRVIDRIVLRDGDVNLEILANKVRNWRLINPDSPAPGKYSIRRLELHESRIHFINHGVDLILAVEARKHDDPQLPTHLDFSGSYRGVKFDGQADTGTVISLQQTKKYFPVQLVANAADTRLQLQGSMADLFRDQLVKGSVQVSGKSLDLTYPFLKARLPNSRAFSISAQLIKSERRYQLDALQASLGNTDLAGTASYDQSSERPLLTARIRSKLLDIEDLTSIGQQIAATRNKSPAPSASPGRVLSSRKFSVQPLRTRDVELQWTAQQLSNSPLLAASLQLDGQLRNGQLHLIPRIKVAGGQLNGDIHIDARGEQLRTKTSLQLRHLDITRLARLPGVRAGAVQGQITLEGAGDSLASLLAAADGQMRLSMQEGLISNKLDARLGLDAGKIVWLGIKGDQDIAMHCAGVQVDIRHGMGQVHKLVLDTAQTHISGNGTLDLQRERFDIVLSPRPKDPSLLSLNSNIHAFGSFRQADYQLEKSKKTSSSAINTKPGLNPNC